MAALILPVLLVATASAATADDLPAAAEVLDAYVEATGGKAAYDKIDNRVTHATLESPGQGIALDLTIYAAKPGVNYTIIESELTGTITKGTDGEIVWENSATLGPQIKEGQEKTDFLRESRFDKLAAWRELYPEVECVGVEPVDEKPAHKVVATPADGKPQTLWFDQASKLLVKFEFISESPMGTIPLENYLSDYRAVDGLLLPHLARIVVLGQERVVTTESIEQNVDLPADRFDLPGEIRALLDDRPVEEATDEEG
jgi:hypothetical protein